MKQRAIRLPIALAHQGVVVVASRSHQTEETTAFIDNLRKQGKPVTLISSGSSLKICLVAEGSADIYPRFAPTMEWDTAATTRYRQVGRLRHISYRRQDFASL